MTEPMSAASRWINGVPERTGLYWVWWEGLNEPLETIVSGAQFAFGYKPIGDEPIVGLVWGRINAYGQYGWQPVNSTEDKEYWYCPMVAPPFPQFPQTKER